MAGSPQQRVAPINAGLLQSLPPWEMDDHIVEYCSLRASSPGRSGGGTGKGTTSLEFEFCLQFPCGSPSTERSDFANQREAKTSANVNNIEKHVEARAKRNDVITSVISANQHFASTFSMQIFKFQRRSYKLSFLFPPRRQSAPESLPSG